MSTNTIRLSKNPPTPRPPAGEIEIFYDKSAGALSAAESDGTKTPLGGATGTAAAKDVGTGAGQVPVLDAGGKLEEGILPSVLTVDGVTLTNTGSVSKDAGTLGLNSSGELILHDGVNNGDDVPIVGYQQSMAFAKGFAQASMKNIAQYKVELGRVRLKGTDLVAGRYLHIVGKISFYFDTATRVDTFTGVYLASEHAGLQAALELPKPAFCAYGEVQSMMEVNCLVSLATEGTGLKMAQVNGGIRMDQATAGTITSAAMPAAEVGPGSAMGPPADSTVDFPAEDQDFILYFLSCDYSDTVCGTVYVCGKLDFNIFTP